MLSASRQAGGLKSPQIASSKQNNKIKNFRVHQAEKREKNIAEFMNENYFCVIFVSRN